MREKSQKITDLTVDTKISDLFNDYPGLKSYMVAKSDKFSLLDTSLFTVMSKVATVKMISKKTGISFEVLQQEFKKYIDSI